MSLMVGRGGLSSVRMVEVVGWDAVLRGFVELVVARGVELFAGFVVEYSSTDVVFGISEFGGLSDGSGVVSGSSGSGVVSGSSGSWFASDLISPSGISKVSWQAGS